MSEVLAIASRHSVHQLTSHKRPFPRQLLRTPVNPDIVKPRTIIEEEKSINS